MKPAFGGDGIKFEEVTNDDSTGTRRRLGLAKPSDSDPWRVTCIWITGQNQSKVVHEA